MTEEAKRTYELVVFGASGYTGEFVAERVAKRAREVSLSWAVAGRNLAKLQKVVDDIAKSTGKPVNAYSTNKWKTNIQSLETIQLYT